MLDDICDVTRSINFANSEDGRSEVWSSQCPSKNEEHYKCFRCYGTSIEDCRECGNLQVISASHPMAKLLGSLLSRKMQWSRVIEERQESESVEAIKEEEEDTEDKKIVCCFCDTECDFSLFSCEQCPWLNVCAKCESRAHEHCHAVNRNLAESIGISVHQVERKHCYNCGHRIENCYSVCRTCEAKQIRFWICDICSDSQNYSHSDEHCFETVIDLDTAKDNQLETLSQEFEEEFESFSLQDEAELPALDLHKENSSIVNQIESEGQSPLLLSLTGQRQQLSRPISRVQFQLDDIFSSYDIKQDTPSRNILRPPSVAHEPFSRTGSEASKSREKENDDKEGPDYFFHDYKCDLCDACPIRNLKYHCTICQDFDLCQNCYHKLKYSHPHTFECTDGRLFREKAFERISQSRETVLRNSYHPNIQEKTKRKPQRLKTVFR